MTLTLSPFSGLHQIAYVTTDISQAIDYFAHKYNVPKWLELREIEIESMAGRKCTQNVALAYVGAIQLELIQPLLGDDHVYRDALPETEFAIRHHHVAQLIATEADFARQRDELAAQGVRIVIDGEAKGMARYFYTDHRATLGHYLEHTWFSPAGLAGMAKVPRNGE
ncbi:hypothetical protein LMG27174_06534 [Paraburkholderia rhynchosiae]|nr:hypothetical protein LMG27174_06534 [Paraburkholderia rhynchosiae]